MNKLLLIIFWLISIIVVFFVGKNIGVNQTLTNIQTSKLEAKKQSHSQVQASSVEHISPLTKTTDMDVKSETFHIAQVNNQLARVEQEKNKLLEEVVTIKQQLTAANQKLQTIQARTDQSLKPTLIEPEEVTEHLSAPFDSVVLNASRDMVNKFKQLQKETQDQTWALMIEQHIADFFVVHDLAHQVKLDGVQCKQTVCEIRGFELEPKAWEKIMSDMTEQSWWQFSSSHSTTQNNKEFGMFFYSLVSKTIL